MGIVVRMHIYFLITICDRIWENVPRSGKTCQDARNFENHFLTFYNSYSYNAR